MPTILPLPAFSGELARVRAARPLVHLLTSEVVQEFSADVLLALGISPGVIVAEEEVAEFAASADALLINVGTLTSARLSAMRRAVAAANEAGVPWVLAPVGAGTLAYRTKACNAFIEEKPAVVCGNPSEIASLAGLSKDAPTSEGALEAAVQLAQSLGAIVAVTGAVDFITDGRETWATPWGHKIMTRVIGIGSALSALVAAFVPNAPDRLEAVASACAIFDLCGGRAAMRVATSISGPGSFRAAFLNELYNLKLDDVRLRP
ncbi:MAG: hydroxyethylthiazole kinase [Candidatus Accumulibacter sp.]|jgi:hydroxyethylthiazole kinase|nr:hydroxyethylthiazole kinase [Accumulibacter sp.]